MLSSPEHLRTAVDHDGAVILDIPANEMTTLNPTGAYIWERLQQGKAPADITAELARETGADETTVADDVQTFIETLLSKRLLTQH
jgi:Coenzyme PQQ synthesis protein D (PqqD)